MSHQTTHIWLKTMLPGPAVIGGTGGYALRNRFSYSTLYVFFVLWHYGAFPRY